MTTAAETTNENDVIFFVTGLLEQLSPEGKDLAVEYMEYLISTGKYRAKTGKKGDRYGRNSSFF